MRASTLPCLSEKGGGRATGQCIGGVLVLVLFSSSVSRLVVSPAACFNPSFFYFTVDAFGDDKGEQSAWMSGLKKMFS